MKKFKNIILLIISVLWITNSYSQCFPDRHNTTWFDGWLSCEEAESPNPERGMSHWIMYDFNHIYGLGKVHIWNVNDNNHLDWGAQFLAVDYSLDGQNWTELDEFTIPKSSGESTYEGVYATDFVNEEARFVLITLKENWGGNCSGFSEIRFEVTNAVDVNELEVVDMIDVDVYPNPTKSIVNINVKSTNSEEINYKLIDMFGKILTSGNIKNPRRENKFSLDLNRFSKGVYNFVIMQGNYSKRTSLIKID